MWNKVQLVRPEMHVFGHIHEARRSIVKYRDDDGTMEAGGPSARDARQRRFTVFVDAVTYPIYKYRELQVSMCSTLCYG